MRQRSAELRVPVFAIVDAGEAIAAVFDFVVGAEKTDGNAFDFGTVAAADEEVADGEVAHGFFKDVIQVGA